MKFRAFLYRTLSALVCLCLLVTLVPVSALAAQEGYLDAEAASVTFRKGQTLFKEKEFTITAKDLKAQDNGFLIVELTVHNTGRHTLYFRDQFSTVGGLSVSASLYSTLLPGKKADITIAIDALPLAAVGFRSIDQLDIIFDVLDDNTYDILWEGLELTIPLGVPIDMDYYPYEKTVYEEDHFRLKLLGSALVNRRNAPSLIFRLENNLDGPIMARNDGELSVYDRQCSFYVNQIAGAYTDAVFSVASYDDIFQGLSSGAVAFMDFPLQICTGNWNPLVDTRIKVSLTDKGKIQQFFHAARKSSAYEVSMGEYNAHKNMFMGTFHNYELDHNYVDILRKKYPDDELRYSDSCFLPYVNELLILYLADLEDAGFDFGVIERPDLCSESSYVVELTEQGKSLIQVAFALREFDPKAATMMTLGCAADNYEDLDTLNRCMEAMWIAFSTANVHMTPEKHAAMMENSESTTSDQYGLMLRGQCDGLGYLQSTSPEFVYLTITPDLTLPIFEGMNTGPKTSH